MVLENIRYELRPPIAVVTIDRPKVLNALNRQSMTELEQVFLDLRQNAEVRAVLLTGAGEKAFVAGADIKELASLSPLRRPSVVLRSVGSIAPCLRSSPPSRARRSAAASLRGMTPSRRYFGAAPCR